MTKISKANDVTASLYGNVVELIRKYGTIENPITMKELAEYLGTGYRGSISPTLTAIVRCEKHIHRLKLRRNKNDKQASFCYWYNPKIQNLEYQGRRTKVYPIPEYKGPIPANLSEPTPELIIPEPPAPAVVTGTTAPSSVQIVVNTEAGPLKLTPRQARETYQQLKALFEE